MRQVLYRIRRSFRSEATLHHVTEASTTPDLITGDVPVSNVTTIELRAFITFDESARRRFEYDLSFIAANKNFTYGGVFETGDRIGILQYVDVGEDFDLTDRHYIVFDSVKYKPFKFVKLDYGLGYLIHMRRDLG